MVIVLLLAAAALHLGFQGVVSLLVYPALVRVAPDRRAVEHAAHRRVVTPVVAVVYGCLAAACAAVLVVGPRTPLALLAVAGAALAAAATAAVAGPAHGRLAALDARGTGLLGARAQAASEVDRRRLLVRLRRADAVRLAGALVSAGAALAAVVAG